MSAFSLGLRRVRTPAVALALFVVLAPCAGAEEQGNGTAPVPTVPSAAPPVAPAAQPAATAPAEEKLSDAQLDQLVAPIALHPDSLLAQILTASTYPLEVEMAARWAKANPNLKGKELENALQRQPWDPSVKSLTAVPQVLQMMSDKLDWTKQIGDAYLDQPDEITRAIQRLRVKAADAGNLKTTKEQKITRVSGPPPARLAPGPDVAPAMAADLDYIAIEPVDPEVVYVPVYNPLLVYGPWPWPAFSPFFWYPPGYVAVGVFAFSAPCFVGPALWARWDWRARRIGVFVPHYNAFNRARWASTGVNPNWSHNPRHRGNIAYSNSGLQQRFGRPGLGGPNAQRANFQQGNPGFGRQGLTGNINPNNGGPRGNLNGNVNPGARSFGGNQNAAINRNVNGNPGSGLNRNPTVNGNINRNVNIQRNVQGANMARGSAMPNAGMGMPRAAMGMPRGAMGAPHGAMAMPRGGMPMGRPAMGGAAMPRGGMGGGGHPVAAAGGIRR